MRGDECRINEGVTDAYNLKFTTDFDVWADVACGSMKGGVAVVKGLLKPEGETQILKEIKTIFSKVPEGDIWSDANSLKVREEIRMVDELSPKQLSDYQHKKLRALLRYAVEYCPFYRELYKGIDIEKCHVTDLPPINKRMMMDNFKDIVTDAKLNLSEIRSYLEKLNTSKVVYQDEFVVGATSGTTGTPGIFCYNFEEWRRVVLSNIRGMDKVNEMEAEGLIGPDGGKGEPQKLVMITAPNYDSLSAITISHLPQWLSTTKILSTLSSTEELVSELNSFKPDILCGHTSRLRDLAYEQLAGRLNIHPERISPFAEHVSDSVKNLLENAFGGEVFIRYQASEVMNIAWDCKKHEGLHLNSDMVILESVDENYSPVPVGTRGDKILVTNLYNYTQPLIRYEISDIVTLSTRKCSCGAPFPLIERVEGRNDAILKFKAKGNNTVKVYPYEIERALSEIHNLHSFQLIQKNKDECLVRFVAIKDEKTVGKMIVTKIKDEVFKVFNVDPDVKVTVKNVTEIPRDAKTGKFRNIINELNAVTWGYTKEQTNLIGRMANWIRKKV
jgi:phenylacetate-coenzyme A ligase PaaK-like adenylate-forming protein